MTAFATQAFICIRDAEQELGNLMEINCSKEIKNTTLPHGPGCCLSSPSLGSFPNTRVHTVNAELEKLEGRDLVETTEGE